jgi:hypothetical protein
LTCAEADDASRSNTVTPSQGPTYAASYLANTPVAGLGFLSKGSERDAPGQLSFIPTVGSHRNIREIVRTSPVLPQSECISTVSPLVVWPYEKEGVIFFRFG